MQTDAHEQSDDQAPPESHDHFERLIARSRRDTPGSNAPNDKRWNHQQGISSDERQFADLTIRLRAWRRVLPDQSLRLGRER
jgi:hypothetical protein